MKKEKIISEVQRLAHAIWPDTFKDILSQSQLEYMLDMMYSTDSLTKQISNGHQFIFSTVEDKNVGFASYEVNYKNSRTRIHKIYVLPEMQGKKLGFGLLKQIKGAATAHKNSTIELNVNKFNKAVEFYKRTGFTIEREEDIDIGNGYFMNDFVMVLAI